MVQQRFGAVEPLLQAVGAGSVFSLSEGGRGVLLNQAVQRGLFRAVALAGDRSAIRRPLGLPADGCRLPANG